MAQTLDDIEGYLRRFGFSFIMWGQKEHGTRMTLVPASLDLPSSCKPSWAWEVPPLPPLSRDGIVQASQQLTSGPSSIMEPSGAASLGTWAYERNHALLRSNQAWSSWLQALPWLEASLLGHELQTGKYIILPWVLKPRDVFNSSTNNFFLEFPRAKSFPLRI
jgi:hypothetical protein